MGSVEVATQTPCLEAHLVERAAVQNLMERGFVLNPKVRKCKLCGKEFELRPNGHTRVYCFECSPPYTKGCNITHAESISVKRRAIKKHLINRLGGKCSRCGYDKYQGALQFHHKDPSQKDFTIAHSFSGDVEKLYAEVDKCELVCANCHAEIHDIS